MLLTLRNRIGTYIGISITGCCTNVYIFEKIININSQITTLITFSQTLFIFLSIAIYLDHNKYWENLKKQGKEKKFNDFINLEFLIPLLSQSLTSNMSNYVFQYNLPMPVHIIFRSSSTAMTLLLGWLIWKKRYTWDKVYGSLIIAIGTVIFTIAVSQNEVIDNDIGNENDFDNDANYFMGILLLLTSTIINSLTSLFKEDIYLQNKKGNKRNKNKQTFEWQEILYYNYLFGVIFYLPMIGQLYREIYIVQNIKKIGLRRLLITNWITQLICIIGVNMLVFKISALSLAIILLIRRFLSLFLSIYVFGTNVSLIGYIGIIFVIIGAIIYSFASKIYYGSGYRSEYEVLKKE